MSRKRGLGKGLDALIPSEAELGAGPSGTRSIPVGEILPNPRQPRGQIEAEQLTGLTQSIQEHGLLQPLVVRPLAAGQGYELIAGQRRLEAARLAGLKSVPAIVREAGERQQLELALVENLQREDLNPLEAAEGYRQLSEDFGLPHQEIAQRIGKSRSAVSNTLRLLKLAEPVQRALSREAISEGHARALLGVGDHRAQEALLRTILGRGLNVRQTEALVQRAGKKRKARAGSARSPDEVDLENRLSAELGTRVRIQRVAKGGRLSIDFYSDEELNAIADRLLGES